MTKASKRAKRCDFAGGECGNAAATTIEAVRVSTGQIAERRPCCGECRPMMRRAYRAPGLTIREVSP